MSVPTQSRLQRWNSEADADVPSTMYETTTAPMRLRDVPHCGLLPCSCAHLDRDSAYLEGHRLHH